MRNIFLKLVFNFLEDFLVINEEFKVLSIKYICFNEECCINLFFLYVLVSCIEERSGIENES